MHLIHDRTVFVAFLIVTLLLGFTEATTATAARLESKYSNPRAVLITQYGRITFELFPEAAPKTVANFISLAKTGRYNNTWFYRNAKFPNGTSFVVQGGFFNKTEIRTVPLEYKIPNDKWTVGLARGDAPDTGNSEYFINVHNNSAVLAPGGATPDGYCVFAQVVDGFAVVDTMTKLPSHLSKKDGMHEFDQFPVVFSVTILF